MQAGEGPVRKTSRKSLRLLGSVGEPINPEAWEWYHRVVGDEHCPIVDTWWQTETGGILITPLPGATKLKPGSATKPFFGVKPEVVDAEGKVLEGACEGNLVIADSWPGQMRTVYGDHERFVQTYFSAYPGKYFTGDGCRRDGDGYYWITGRVDDVINVSGHRMGTAEVESALVAHPKVSEAAVVGYPHDIKGQGIYAYVTLMAGEAPSEDLRKELVVWVRKEIGPIASPDLIQFAPGLPKTRSGKIMRRILRKIAEDEFGNLGDTSTLADPAVVDDLVANRQNRTALRGARTMALRTTISECFGNSLLPTNSLQLKRTALRVDLVDRDAGHLFRLHPSCRLRQASARHEDRRRRDVARHPARAWRSSSPPSSSRGSTSTARTADFDELTRRSCRGSSRNDSHSDPSGSALPAAPSRRAAALAAGPDLGAVQKQSLNWVADRHVPALRARHAGDHLPGRDADEVGRGFLCGGRRHHGLPERPCHRRRLHVGGLVPRHLRPRLLVRASTA